MAVEISLKVLNWQLNYVGTNGGGGDGGAESTMNDHGYNVIVSASNGGYNTLWGTVQSELNQRIAVILICISTILKMERVFR